MTSSQVTNLISGLSTLAAVVGVAYGAYDVGSQLYSGNLSPGRMALSGAGLGAGIGTLISPGIGTLIGALIGAGGGALAGSDLIPGLNVGGGRAIGNFLLGPLNPDALEEWLGLGDSGARILSGVLTAGLGAFLPDLFEAIFGKASLYGPKRATAAETANLGLQTLAPIYQEAARSGDPMRLLSALQRREGGATGAVRTDLSLTPEMAQRIGIEGDVIGDRIVAQWINISQEQFARLLKEFGMDKDLIMQSIVGSGDVPYLEGPDAQAIADSIKNAAIKMLEAFVLFDEVRDRVTELSEEIAEVADDFLPPATAQRFKNNILKKLTDQIAAVSTSGLPVEEMTAELKGLEATLQAYVALINLYGQLTADFAKYTGNFVESVNFTRQTIFRAREAARERVQEAAEEVGIAPARFEEIEAGVNLDNLEQEISDALKNLTPELAFERLNELREAVIARYDFERELILGIEADIQGLYENFFDGLERRFQLLGSMQADMFGDMSYFEAVIDVLGQFATQSLSVSEALYTAASVLRVTLASIPSRIAGVGGSTGNPNLPGSTPGQGGLGLNEIFPAILQGLNPFIQTLNTQIAQAIAAGDFETAMLLMEQLGDGIQAAYEAAIAGVRQWEQQQIAAVNRAADAQIRAIEATRDAQIEALDVQADAIQDQIDAIDDQKWAITQQKWIIEDAISALEDTLKPLEDSLEAVRDQQQDIRNNLIRPIERQIRGIERLMRPIEKQLALYQKQIDQINDDLDDQLRLYELRTRELNDEKDIIEDQIALIEEWSEVVEGLRDFMLDLALGGQAPPDTLGQFQIAQAEFNKMLAAFTAEPDAEDVGGIQDMASQMLELFAQLVGQPSTEYQDFFALVMGQLGSVLDIATGLGGDPAQLDDLRDQLEIVNDELELIADLTEDLRNAAEDQVHAIEDLMDPLEDALDAYQEQIDILEDSKQIHEDAIEDLDLIAQGIEDQIDQIQEQIDIQREALNTLSRAEQILSRTEQQLGRDLGDIRDDQEDIRKNAQDQIDAINKSRDDQIDAIELAAQAQIDYINVHMLPVIIAQQEAATNLHGFMRDFHYQRLIEFTQGYGTAAWMKLATENTSAWIGHIMNALDRFLGGELKPVVRVETAAGTTDEQLISVLGDVDTTLQNLDATLQAVNANLGGGVGYVPPSGGNGDGGSGGNGYQHGAMYVHPGVYELHEGEMVVPKVPAERLRHEAAGWEGMGQGNQVTVSIGSISIVSANANPKAVSDEVLMAIERDIRSGGRLRRVIQGVV